MGAMLFNREGRRVIVDPALYSWYLEFHDYKEIPYIINGRGEDFSKVAVTREIGGLGDVICVQSVVAALQAQGFEVTLYTPEKFWPVCIADHLVDTSSGVSKPGPEEYFSRVFNMFCPAGDYEGKSRMRPVKGRIRNFCEAAEVEPAMPPIKDRIGPPIRVNGELNIEIGIQPMSENPSKDLTMAQLGALVAHLQRRGARCHVFHDRPLSGLRCEFHIKRPLEEVARRIRGLDVMIAVDSGLLHLAAVLDVPTVGIFGPTNGPITCEFYPAVSIIQASQPVGIECFTPCYYNQDPNGYVCRKRQGYCMKEFDVAVIAEEALHRAWAGEVRHHISDHWLSLNLETYPHHGGIHVS